MTAIDLEVRISVGEAFDVRDDDIVVAVDGLRRNLALRNVHRRLREERLDGRTALALVDAARRFEAPAA